MQHATPVAHPHCCALQGAHANPADVSILAGCGCILDTLLFTLADAGTCMAIPAPYYPAFDIDLKVLLQVSETHTCRADALGH